MHVLVRDWTTRSKFVNQSRRNIIGAPLWSFLWLWHFWVWKIIAASGEIKKSLDYSKNLLPPLWIQEKSQLWNSSEQTRWTETTNIKAMLTLHLELVFCRDTAQWFMPCSAGGVMQVTLVLIRSDQQGHWHVIVRYKRPIPSETRVFSSNVDNYIPHNEHQLIGWERQNVNAQPLIGMVGL